MNTFVVLCALLASALAVPTSGIDGEARPRYEDQPSGERIVGGVQIRIEDAPYQFALLSRGYQICGGSIISSNWVITAAHCTYGASASSLSIRVGSSAHASGGQVISVSRIAQHPSYNSRNIDYDYSLLELSSPISFDATKKPVPLPNQDEPIADGASSFVTGWGNTQNSAESSSILRGVYVPIVNQATCNSNYASYGGVTARMLCAGFAAGGKDACQGDSGGPLVANGKLHGVVSWGAGCAKPNYPGVYSRVSYVRDWIKSTSGV